MANISEYKKPSMTNLPPELGKAIFMQIINAPAPDRAKMKRESDELLNDMIKVRDEEDAQGNITE